MGRDTGIKIYDNGSVTLPRRIKPYARDGAAIDLIYLRNCSGIAVDMNTYFNTFPYNSYGCVCTMIYPSDIDYLIQIFDSYNDKVVWKLDSGSEMAFSDARKMIKDAKKKLRWLKKFMKHYPQIVADFYDSNCDLDYSKGEIM